jgi:enterochelin esterase-like enzyme
VRRVALVVLACLALPVAASATTLPPGWTIADAGPRGGATYAGRPIDGVGALYLPAGFPSGDRMRVAYLLAGRDDPVQAARRLGLAAAGDELSWQRTTAPFAVVVTTARGPRTLGLAMRFAQHMLPLSRVIARRAVIGVGPEAAAALRSALQPRLRLGTGIGIGGRIPGGLARAAERAVRAHRLRVYRPAPATGVRRPASTRHLVLEGLAFAFAPAAAGRASRAAEVVAPYGWVRIAAGPYGGTVWQGVIPNHADPGQRRASLVYLPPGIRPNLRYPALYLLHGLRGSPYSFVGGLRLAAVADTLIHARRVRPFIAVMPPAGPSPQFDGEWTGPWEHYVVHEVVPWSERHLPLSAGRPARALAGFSAGAYGAVDMGLRHPGEFGTLESWSGYFKAPRDGSLANATAAERAAHDPLTLLPAAASALRAGGVRFFLSAGRHEPRTLLATRAFARELSALGLEHALDVTAGGHHGRTWRAVLPEGLRYAFAR